MSGKYILRTAEDGYLTQKNISFAFLRCIGVSVDEFTVVKKIFILQFLLTFTRAHAGVGRGEGEDGGASSSRTVARKGIRGGGRRWEADSRGTNEYLERVYNRVSSFVWNRIRNRTSYREAIARVGGARVLTTN